MSEGFELEPFHVPQQSRRDKLRETTSTGCAGLLPLYDPSLLSSSMLTCAPSDQNPPLISSQCMNFMGFLGTGNSFLSSSSSSSQLLLDLPQSSISINPNCNEQDINNSSSNPFLFASQIPQNLRDFDPSFDNAPQTLSYATHDTKSTGQGLSLSLSSQYRNRSDVRNYVVPGSDSMARSLAPIGPFTGYAAILKGSRFLKPAQQLLEEFCDVGRGFYMERNGGESSSSSVGREMENLSESGIGEDGQVGVSGGGERRRMKARLISMLNEVWYTFALSLL